MVTEIQDRERYAAIIQDAYALANQALGRIQAAQTDPALYDLLLDLNSLLVEARTECEPL